MTPWAPAALAAVLTLWPAVASGQGFELGLKGGVSFATVTPGTADSDGVAVDRSTAAGVVIGGALAFGLAGPFAIQPEVLFVAKAHTIEFSSGPQDAFPIDFRGTESLNYLEVPVLLRVRLSEGGFHALAGPSLNVSLDRGDLTEPLDVGVVLGAGFYGPLVTVEAIRGGAGGNAVDMDRLQGPQPGRPAAGRPPAQVTALTAALSVPSPARCTASPCWSGTG